MKPLAQNTMIQNRYLIIQMIGKGGMGEVYLSVDQRLGSAVALKRTFFAGDEMLGNAFEREARILARMRHPVLPKVSDHFSEGEEQYLVMEHISGDDLAKRLEVAQKPFPLSWVMFWADQLLDALSYLHSHEPPIIHRDIKPQNLKLTDENHIILLDFGLSKSSTGNTNAGVGRSGSSGSTGSVVGYTPHYAPMEQIRGIGTNQRSDLYSLSATLYQLLTNTVPADALTRADSLINGDEDPIIPLSQLNAEVPKSVSDVILKGMEVSQEKRFDNAREMQKTLRKAFASMQTAMSAQTVAFNIQEQQEKAANEPIAATMDKTEVMQFGVPDVPGEISAAGNATYTEPAQGETDFDATIAFDPGGHNSLPKQSDLKTEVFLGSGGSTPFGVPETPRYEPEINVTPAESYTTANEFEDFSEPTRSETASNGESFSPDATMPIIAFQDQNASSANVAGQSDFFTTPGFSDRQYDDQSAGEPVPAEVAAQSTSSASVVPAAKVTAKKSSTGKIVAIFAGLFAVFILALGGIAGGLYYYNNYYAATVQDEPTPTPEPTFEPTPSPEPTIDNTYGSNLNSNTQSETNSNSNSVNQNSDLRVEPTPFATPESADPRPRQTPVQQGPAVRPTPTRPARTPSPVRPTPAPTRDRTIILQ